MVNTATGEDEEEKKAALVRRLQAMEAAEEHDGLFDAPVPFGSAQARQLIQTGGGVTTTVTSAIGASCEVSASCDADDGMDHYIYTDPEQDKAVWSNCQLAQ